MELKLGDVVCLKSGGHEMTVSKIQGDQVVCIWSDSGRRIKERAFSEHLLQQSNQRGVVSLIIERCDHTN